MAQRVLLADDHALIREGLKTILASDPEFHVVGEAANGEQALDLAITLRPDLVVMDISMPKASGLKVARRLLELVPEARLCFLSMHRRPEYVIEAFHAGASGYILKDTAPAKLLHALRRIAEGSIYLDSDLSRDLLPSLPGPADPDGSAPRPRESRVAPLTTREREILALVGQGLTNQEIGERLHISPKTARNHREHIMSKLNAHTAVELARAAMRLGLADMDE